MKIILTTVVVVALLLLIAYVIFKFKNHNKEVVIDGERVFMETLMRDESISRRYIVTTGMSEQEVKRAINDFLAIYSQDRPIERPTAVKKEGNSFILEMASNVDYSLFCYWVNYLVYSNKEKKYNDNVIGWYEVSPSAKGFWKPYIGQKIKFFIPASDSDFDNVYFMTPDNICYKQEFAYDSPLVMVSGDL